MKKLKKNSARALAFISAFTILFSAMFCPFEEFRADEGLVSNSSSSYTLSISHSRSGVTPISNNLMNVNNLVTFVLTHPTYYDTCDYTLFDFYSAGLLVQYGSSDVYAYKVDYTISLTSSTLENVLYVYGSYGSYDDIVGGKGSNMGPISNGRTSSIWYVNDYSELPMFVGLIVRVAYWDNANASAVCKYSQVGSIKVTVTPYVIDDLTDEIYTTLTNIYATDTQMLTYLKNIYTSVDTVETKLQNLYNIANSQLSYLKEIDANTDELESLMGVCNSLLEDIKTELEEQTTWLEKIWNTLVEFFTPSDDEQTKVDDFNSNSSEQSGELNDYNQELDNVQKPTVEDSSNVADNIEQFIPSEDNFVVMALSIIMENQYIFSGVMCSVLMCFVAYVLYGKR